MAQWRTWRADGFCPDCDHWLEIFNDIPGGGWVEDGDLVRCKNTDCPRHTRDLGHIKVTDGDWELIFDPWPRDDTTLLPVEPPYANPKQ